MLNKGHGSTTWEKVSNTTTGAQAFGDASERWHDTDSAITIKVRGGGIIGVQANLSRLLTGNSHNGVIVRDQEQTDQALSRMWDALDVISEGPRSCEFTSVEFGGVIEAPYTQLELLLKNRNLPKLRKAPLLRRGESMKFGAARRAALSLQFYDKGKEMASKLDMTSHEARDRWTRIELKLSGKKLRELMSDDVRKDDAGNIVPAPVVELVYDDWVAKFYDVLYSLDPDDSGNVPLVNNNFVQTLAAMSMYPDLLMDGVHPVDLFMTKVAGDRASRIKKAMAMCQLQAVSLRELVPMDPMPEPIDLVPVPQGIV